MKTVACRSSQGFTLVEMLTVISIAGILAVLTIPAIQGVQQAGEFDKALYGVSDSLNLARAYAMAENTYVYVGLTELDRSQKTTDTPQNKGVGRIALSIVSTKDGTPTVSTATPATGDNLTQVRKVAVFDAIHIASGPFTTGTGTGNMTRATALTPTTPTLPVSTLASGYSLPMGSTTGSGQYNFSDNTNTAMICFTPQGGVLLNGATVQLVEVDLQPVKGTATPSAPANVNKGNHAALLIDGVTGAVSVYRP